MILHQVRLDLRSNQTEKEHSLDKKIIDINNYQLFSLPARGNGASTSRSEDVRYYPGK
jgi:hypothetical protein